MRTFIACMILLPSLVASAADGWKLLYTIDGIAVSSIERGAITEYKAEGVIDESIFELMAVLSDLPRRVEWMNNLKEIRVLRGEPETHLIIFNVFDLPWPAQDRESVIDASARPDYAARTIHMEYRTIDDPTIPVGEHRVRVPFATGATDLKFLSEKSTQVSVSVSMDPGGNIPDWVADLVVRNVPIRTLRGLKAQVAKTRGQYDAFVKEHQSRMEAAGGG